MKKLSAANPLTLAQQRKAIKILKNMLAVNDEAAGGIDDFPDSLEARVFLIDIGAIPDRRKK